MEHYPFYLQEEPDSNYLKKLADSDRPLHISLTNDFAFKKIFRNKKALTGLLSGLLEIPAETIAALEFPDTFEHGEYPDDHEGILDVKVLLNNSRKINIEIQLHSYPFWEERSLFYLSKMYLEDFQKGEEYSALKECVHISILGFDLEQAEDFYSVIKLTDVRSHKVYSGKQSLRVLYLKKLKDATEEEKKTAVYKWARLISAQDWEVLREMAGSDDYMNAAVEEMEKINTDKNLRYRYLMSEKAASDETTLRNYYTNKGRKEGREEGALIKLTSQIRRKQQKGITVELIAQMLEEDIQLVQRIYQCLTEHPEYTDEEICKRL